MASTLDKITDTRNAARPNSARVSSGRSAGGSTLACDNLTGWPTASKVHFVTYRIDSSSNPVAGTQLDCSGIVSGNNVGTFVVIDGTDSGNNVGDVVEMLPTAAWGQDLADALSASHDRDGTLKDGAVDAAGVLASNVVTTAKILDLAVTTAKINDLAITTAKLNAAAVTPDKLGLSPSTASVATSETTTSTSYADLSTTTDTAIVTIGANGIALVIIGCKCSNSGANETYASFAISGANTLAASDANALNQGANAQNFTLSRVRLITGLTPGSTTFKMKYRVTGGTGTFSVREIGVIPL